MSYLHSANCCTDPVSISLPSGSSGVDPSWDFDSIWLRRLPPVRLPDDLAENQIDYAQGCWGEFFNGIKSLKTSKWINNPAAHQASNNKIHQLREANRLGFVIPRTIVSNDYRAVRRFASEVGDIVCKTLSIKVGWPALATVRLTPVHIAALDNFLVSSPAIFQEYIEAEADVRITVVGNEIFSAEICTQKGIDKVDWRFDPNNRWYVHSLPDQIKTMCCSFVKLLGLKYGAIDMRINPNGEYIFFEINPGGQFAFIEAWTGLPISREIAKELVSLARS